MMPNGDPQDGFCYPTLTLMINSYNLNKPHKAKRRYWGRIFLSYTHTHERFFIISASLMMTNSDPGDRFFYPTLKLIIDSYNLGKPRDTKR